MKIPFSAFIYSFLCICLFNLVSCDCDDEIKQFDIEYNEPFFTYIVSTDTAVYIRFNKELDTTKVLLNENIFIRIVGEDYYNGDFEIHPMEIRFNACDLGCGGPPGCDIEVKMEGENSDSEVIVSKDNQVLDGDFDGIDGGDFMQIVWHICNEDPPVPVFPPEVLNASSTGFAFDPFGVDIIFTEVMDFETFIPGSTIFLMDGDSLIDFNITTTADSEIISLETTKTILDLCFPSSHGELTLIISGDGVKSVEGKFLDGDGDGIEGPDYEKELLLFVQGDFCVTSPVFESTLAINTTATDAIEYNLNFSYPTSPSTIWPGGVSFLTNIDNGNDVPIQILPTADTLVLKVQTLQSAETICAPDSSCTLEFMFYLMWGTDGLIFFDEDCINDPFIGGTYKHLIELSY